MAGQRASSLVLVNEPEFMARLSAAFVALRLETEADLLRTAIGVTNYAKMYCPVATGNLRASINNTEILHDTPGNAYVIVGTGVEYAPYVEFGTWKMHAQPYLRPALAMASRMFGSGAAMPVAA